MKKTTTKPVSVITTQKISKKKKWSEFKRSGSEKTDLIQNQFDQNEWTW